MASVGVPGELHPTNMSGRPGKAPLVAARVPADVVDQLDQVAETDGLSRSELVREAIAHYLDQRLARTG